MPVQASSTSVRWLRKASERVKYHKKRCDDPIDQNAEAKLDPNLAMSKNAMQGLISNFA